MNDKENKRKLDNSGQALVEFVLILPVFIFLLFAVYDMGMIFSRESALESNSSDIIALYNSGKSIDEIKGLYPKIKINISEDSEYKEITISENIKLITPGFNRIFGNPYKIKVVRYIPNEQ